jgi:hypothetical protein
MRRIFFDRVESWSLKIDYWLNRHPEVPRLLAVAGLTILGLMLLTAALPLFVAVAIGLVIAYFVRVWLREFAFLMGVDDSAFPGHNDKLIWAILLIVLPPLGLILFRAHRRAYWPETDAKSAQVADELA